MSITIENRQIGEGSSAFIIAEIGINHNGNPDMAKKLIDSAVKSGADAVKFQTYITEKRVSKDSPIFDILKECELPFNIFRELKEYCNEQKVVFFSTPFDGESLEFLEGITCPAYKVASFDLVNKRLLMLLAKTNKPIIMSCGMSNEDEIRAAIRLFPNNEKKLALLHCVTSYPAEKKDADLNSIERLKLLYNGVIGYSDHTLGIKAAVYSVAKGAKIVEKHFTIDCQLEGADHAISADPGQFSQMAKDIRELEEILGKGELEMRCSELKFSWLRRFS